MLTGAVRDLHLACPGRFQIDVRTSADALWENNPYLTRLKEGEAGVEVIHAEYPLIQYSNQRPYHFIHGYAQFLEERLGVRIPVTAFKGDLHLSQQEKRLVSMRDLQRRFRQTISRRFLDRGNSVNSEIPSRGEIRCGVARCKKDARR